MDPSPDSSGHGAAHAHWEPKHATPPDQRVPVWRKAAYGFGGLTDFLYLNIVNAMAVPIFAIALKMDPFLVAVAMAIPKVIGAVMDPVVGGMSDNTRSRWGRRRPYILGGGIAGAAIMPLLWMPPALSQAGMFAYLAILLAVFAVAYSFFAVPYGALGFQLSTDYDERTRVLAWKSYIQMIGTLSAAWYYWFCLHPMFGGEVNGIRWLSAIAGVVMLGGVLATFFGCKEKTETFIEQPRVPLGHALKLTFSNRPFMLLQAAVLIIALGTGCEGLIGSYVHIYYTCQGSKEFASYISGIGGSLTIFATLASVPLGVWLSTHTSKRRGALIGLGISLLAVCLLPFTLVPQTPYLIIVSWIILALGMPCASLMFGSMTADITDEDELATGMRREGLYIAVGGFFGKIVNVVTLLLGGWLPHLAGYSDTSVPPNQDHLGAMRAMLIGIQIAALFAAIVIIWFYPLTRARSEETRRILDARKAAL